MFAVVEIGGALLGRGSLKPKPGSAGITKWKGCWVPASSGSVRGEMKRIKDRLVKGKGGIRSSGTAFA